jgi:glyoxylase-like metal-dependent hydrolase (beta-lactamase superfamily II)
MTNSTVDRGTRSTPSRHLHAQSLVLAGFGALLLAACAASPPPPADEKPRALAAVPTVAPPVIHTVTASVAGLSVNSYLVEGKTGVVAVDSALTVTDANALRAKLDALGKPLIAVLLTHGHPDHYNGVTALVAGNSEVPIYATAAVVQVIREFDAKKEAQWKPMFGTEWPAKRTFPNQPLDDGATLALDGISWTVHALGPGESHADSYWTLEADKTYVFLGDVVLYGEHAYVNDGHTAAWLETLHRLHADLRGATALYPGHGAAGGLELLDWEEAYLTTYRKEVEDLRRGSARLADSDKPVLVARMKKRYPTAGLDFMIELGADTVAAELASAR